MAARANPSKGAKPDKLMRDALMIALKRIHEKDGKKTTYLSRIAANLAEKAATNSDLMAIKEIFDRIDGKPAQSLTVGGDPESGPVIIRWET